MSHPYRNLPQRNRAPENPGRPVFGKRAAPPTEPVRPVSAARASKAFCALMIVLAAVVLVWAI